MDSLMMTEYVVTRWYRAPELLCENSVELSLGDNVDIWMGSRYLVARLHLRGAPGTPATSSGEKPDESTQAGHPIAWTSARRVAELHTETIGTRCGGEAGFRSSDCRND